jgi:hypothetical protein
MRSYPLFILAFICTALTASAQLKLPINNAFRSDIQKVVEAFPHQFSTIRGDVVAQNPQTVEYASTVKPGGSQEAMVVKYSALLKPVYSWQAVMLTTEDYEEAVKKYKWLFNQLKGMNVKYVADHYTLHGTYETPDESRKFTTSILTPAHPPMALKKLKVEVSMQFEFPEWKVSVLIYEKEREDTDQYSETR